MTIILVGGCVQKELIEKGAPEIFVCGSAETYATIIKSFTTREFGNPYIIVNLTNIYDYKTGKSRKQLIDNGDKLEINIIGEIDYSKCPQSTEEGPGGIKKIVPCELTDEQKYGSWNSYNLKEGFIIKLSIQCKDISCDECAYWEVEDSKITIPSI